MNRLLVRLLLTLSVMSISALSYADCSTVSLPTGWQLDEYEDCKNELGLYNAYDEAGKYGFIQQSGAIAIPARFDEAWGFSDNLALVKINGYYGYIQPNGEYAITPIYDDGWRFSNGIAKVQKEDKFGFIDTQGNVQIPLIYDKISLPKNGYIIAARADKQGLLDTQGNVLIPFNYTDIDYPSEGMVLAEDVQDDGSMRQGFLDMNGSIALPFIYESAGSFVGGVAEVEVDWERQLINKYGEQVEPKANLMLF